MLIGRNLTKLSEMSDACFILKCFSSFRNLFNHTSWIFSNLTNIYQQREHGLRTDCIILFNGYLFSLFKVYICPFHSCLCGDYAFYSLSDGKLWFSRVFFLFFNINKQLVPCYKHRIPFFANSLTKNYMHVQISRSKAKKKRDI